jgi:hypothetical protein
MPVTFDSICFLNKELLIEWNLRTFEAKFACEDELESLFVLVREEGDLTAEESEHYDSHAPDIALVVITLAFHDLWGNIVNCSKSVLMKLARVQEYRCSKVNHLNFEILRRRIIN